MASSFIFTVFIAAAFLKDLPFQTALAAESDPPSCSGFLSGSRDIELWIGMADSDLVKEVTTSVIRIWNDELAFYNIFSRMTDDPATRPDVKAILRSMRIPDPSGNFVDLRSPVRAEGYANELRKRYPLNQKRLTDE